jgi:CPA1 family monovalent cation:H+ antiporter
MDGYWHYLIFGLLAMVAALVALARAVRVPYPILLVLGGVALGFVPLMPPAELPPDIVLLVFLPPILYSASVFSSPRQLRANLRAIASLAGGVTFITAMVVGWVAHAALGLPLAAGFVLGAIVAPTDPVTVNAIANRLGVPRHIVTILEGESLINDGVAVVIYHISLVTVMTGQFSVGGALLTFVEYVAGGVAIGLAVGWLARQIRMRLHDRLVEITISLITSYAAFIPAHALHESGVLAAVAAGLYLGWYEPEITGPRSRLQMYEVWEVLPFLVNALLFILIGLQLPGILHGIENVPAPLLLRDAGLVVLAVIATRILTTFPFAYIPRWLSRRVRATAVYRSWREVGIVSYAGMRGGVSLALALAVPLTLHSGAPFPGRNLILFTTFCVIFITLVPLGLTLPVLVRALGLATGREAQQREEIIARLTAARAALAKLDELAGAEWVPEDSTERLRELYQRRCRRYAARVSEDAPEHGDGIDYEARSKASQRLHRELLAAERMTLLQLRNEGRISDDIRRRVERDIDLEDAHLGF